MPILTQKELVEKGLTPLPANLDKREKVESQIVEDPPKPPKDRFRWALMHPENGANGDLQNFEDVLNLDGTPYKRVCHRGVVKTIDEPLAEFLISKGYQLMYKEKI